MMPNSKLEMIVSSCKGCVTVTSNEHTNDYCSVTRYFESKRAYGVEFDEDDEVSILECIEYDCIWEVQAYPRTPIGFYTAIGGTMDKSLDRMIEVLRKTQGKDFI